MGLTADDSPVETAKYTGLAGTAGINAVAPASPNVEPLTASISVERTVQPIDFESAKVFLCVSGIRPETTPDEIDEILDQTKIVYTKIVGRIREKTEKLRKEWK